jgi:hypothetical protein
MAFTFQGWLSVSWSQQTFRKPQHQQNFTKCWKNSRYHPQRLSPNNPWAHRHHGISYGVWQEILKENLNMHRIAAKFILRLLINDQQQHVNMCLELREKANEDPTFISRIITGDESWIYSYGYDPKTKQQSLHWKSSQSPRAKKARQVRSSTNSMLIVFSTWTRLFSVNLNLLTLQYTLLLKMWCFEMLERKCVLKKTGTLAQPQLAPSSWQHNCSNVPENHTVSFSILPTRQT